MKRCVHLDKKIDRKYLFGAVEGEGDVLEFSKRTKKNSIRKALHGSQEYSERGETLCLIFHITIFDPPPPLNIGKLVLWK